MRTTKILLIFVMSLLMATSLMGCDILSSLVKEGEGTAPLGQFLNRTPTGEALPVITTPIEGEQTVKLYFADESGKRLTETQRTIPKTLSLARETLNQWLLGPAGGAADVYPVVSSQTKLRDINIKNGIAIVDLSKEYLEPYGNVSREVALYGLVNTIAQFPTVEMVEIRIDGKGIGQYRGIQLKNLRFRNDLVGTATGLVQQETVKKEEVLEEKPLEFIVEEPKAAPKPKASPSTVNLFSS